jgi:hypothetical protein
MTQQQVMNQRAEPGQPDAPAAGDQLARQEAIKQIERRRRFWVRATVGTVGAIVLAVIWALAEYQRGRLADRTREWAIGRCNPRWQGVAVMSTPEYGGVP